MKVQLNSLKEAVGKTVTAVDEDGDSAVLVFEDSFLTLQAEISHGYEFEGSWAKLEVTSAEELDPDTRYIVSGVCTREEYEQWKVEARARQEEANRQFRVRAGTY